MQQMLKSQYNQDDLIEVRFILSLFDELHDKIQSRSN